MTQHNRKHCLWDEFLSWNESTDYFSCNYFNLHRYTHRRTKTPKDNLHYGCPSPHGAVFAYCKNTMIVDIKWIQAGCCGWDVLFSHEAAVHDADLACVKNHIVLNFHTSSTNGVFLRCPLAAMVFLPSTNFFAAYKTKNGTEICFNKKKKKPFLNLLFTLRL